MCAETLNNSLSPGLSILSLMESPEPLKTFMIDFLEFKKQSKTAKSRPSPLEQETRARLTALQKELLTPNYYANLQRERSERERKLREEKERVRFINLEKERNRHSAESERAAKLRAMRDDPLRRERLREEERVLEMAVDAHDRKSEAGTLQRVRQLLNT